MAPEQYQTVNEVHDSVPAPATIVELDLFVVNRLLDVARPATVCTHGKGKIEIHTVTLTISAGF